MRKVEQEIKAIFAKADLGIWPEGQVKCGMSGGSVGHTGSIVSGLLKKTKNDITQILDKLDLEYGDDFGSKLFELREESKKEKLGPIYRCNINVKGKILSLSISGKAAHINLYQKLSLILMVVCQALFTKRCSLKI